MPISLDKLNPQQQLAVTAPLLPVLVLAGAGSGKTRVLAYRIGYLVEEGSQLPENILALTFTNKAAKEMQHRVQALLHSEIPNDNPPAGGQISNKSEFGYPRMTNNYSLPTMGTFHGLGVKILHQYGYLLGLSRVFTIIDTEDALKIIKENLTLRGVGEEVKPQAVMHFIHKVKNTGIRAEDLAEEYRGYLKQLFLDAYGQYQTALQRQGVVDLDDLVLLPVKLLRTFPEVRSYYNQKFRYILVDEYQDTNPVQYEFLRLLSPPAGIFVVGDDAQSIYGFRGSDITNILNFERDFEGAQVVVLDQNYRSTQNILAVADTVLKHSIKQKPKTMWTENKAGQKVVVRELADEYEEASFVVERIAGGEKLEIESGIRSFETGNQEPSQEIVDDERPFSVLDYMLGQKRGRRESLLRQGYGGQARIMNHESSLRLPEEHGLLSRFAVLYRTHAQSRALEEAFLSAGIPYRVYGGLRFYDRAEVKDALSALNVLLNIRNGLALKRVLSKPNNGIGQKTIAGLREAIEKNQELRIKSFETLRGPETLEGNPAEEDYIKENLELVQATRQELETLPRTKSRASVIEFLNQLESWLETPADSLLSDLLLRIINESGLIKTYSDGTEAGDSRVENLMELVSVARQYNDKGWKESLPIFLESVALVTELDGSSDETDAVTLLTLHSAKGLEFDVVFFVGLEEGILPHSRSMLDEAALAEEVRLAYVGITRARHELYMTYARQRGVFGETRMSVPSRLLRTLPNSAVSKYGERATTLPGHELSDGGVEYAPVEE